MIEKLKDFVAMSMTNKRVKFRRDISSGYRLQFVPASSIERSEIRRPLLYVQLGIETKQASKSCSKFHKLKAS